MAIKYDGTTIPEDGGTIKWGTTSLTDIIFAGVTVWEKVTWKAYSSTKTNPTTITDSGYTTEQYVQFTLSDSLKITKVTCTPYVYAHGAGTPQIYGTIEVSDDGSTWTRIKQGSYQSPSLSQGETYTGTTITYEWSDGCPYKYIRCYTRGTSWKRQVTGTISGYQKS